uniref:Transmembrane protein 230 n=1 Tax=Callithrix jacchus TaxID=9483 RepID=A0A2R8MZ57_CALJA
MMPSRTNLATGIPSSKVKYSRLSSTDDGYIDLQFKKSPPKIPYKAIALATVLFLIGAFLIIIGSLLLSGYISKGSLGATSQEQKKADHRHLPASCGMMGSVSGRSPKGKLSSRLPEGKGTQASLPD